MNIKRENKRIKKEKKRDYKHSKNKEKKLVFMHEKFKEPLFLISLFICIAAIVRPLFQEASIYNHTTYIMIFLMVISLYFTYINFKVIKNYYIFGIPVLIFITVLFSWYADTLGAYDVKNFTVLSIVFGVYLLFYSTVIHKILEQDVAIISAIFFSTLLVHLASAFFPYLSGMDPYYYYRLSEDILDTGYLTEHDYMAYPNPENPSEGGVDLSNARLMASLLMAFLAIILKPIGMTLHDVATLYPGIIASFTIVVVYLLVKELFSDMKPHNKVVAMLASFMLISIPAFAMKSMAGWCEDDALGMFFLVSAFYLLTISLRRRSLKFAFLSGFSLLMLGVTYSGYSASIITLSIFGILYAVMNFIHKKSCIAHMPYIMISVFISFLAPLILHAKGIIPDFTVDNIVLIPFGGLIFITFTLETIRSYKYGMIKTREIKIEDKIENIAHRYAFSIGSAVLLIATMFLIFNYSEVTSIFQIINENKDIVSIVTQEQSEKQSMHHYFGITFFLGVFMIPVLLFYTFIKRSIGASFVLSWSMPIIWMAAHNPYYVFLSSVPIAVLGSTIGLLARFKREDLKGLSIIITLIVLLIPLAFVPFLGEKYYNSFPSVNTMNIGPFEERFYLQPALEWLKNKTDRGDTILVVWGYGNLITGVSDRQVVADNRQLEPIRRDTSRFFFNVTSEEEALKIAKKYNVQWVVMDFSLVKASREEHFIVSNNPLGDLSKEKSYGLCGFSKKDSTLTELVFACNKYIAGLVFTAEAGENSSRITVVDKQGKHMPWNEWIKTHNASVLGSQKLSTILYNAVHRRDMDLTEPYRAIIYIPDEFNDYMTTRLYLGDNADNYHEVGLCTADWCGDKSKELKHFELVEDFRDTGNYSYGGYVRVYRVNY